MTAHLEKEKMKGPGRLGELKQPRETLQIVEKMSQGVE
jgi:hypothetical protein